MLTVTCTASGETPISLARFFRTRSVSTGPLVPNRIATTRRPSSAADPLSAHPQSPHGVDHGVHGGTKIGGATATNGGGMMRGGVEAAMTEASGTLVSTVVGSPSAADRRAAAPLSRPCATAAAGRRANNKATRSIYQSINQDINHPYL